MNSDQFDSRARHNGLFRAYLRELLRFDPPAIRRAMLLNIVSAATEGAGLLLLLPLLTLAGVFDAEGGDFKTAGRIPAGLKPTWNFE
ncbi:MAG: hypothetical protein KGZ58_13660, partial [Ignavibacteriales bacterium]|nr:hypothetical protein [Ignavibacteriales bacterium]